MRAQTAAEPNTPSERKTLFLAFGIQIDPVPGREPIIEALLDEPDFRPMVDPVVDVGQKDNIARTLATPAPTPFENGFSGNGFINTS